MQMFEGNYICCSHLSLQGTAASFVRYRVDMGRSPYSGSIFDVELQTGRVITKVNLNEQPSVTFQVSSGNFSDIISQMLLLLVIITGHFLEDYADIQSKKSHTKNFMRENAFFFFRKLSGNPDWAAPTIFSTWDESRGGGKAAHRVDLNLPDSAKLNLVVIFLDD